MVHLLTMSLDAVDQSTKLMLTPANQFIRLLQSPVTAFVTVSGRVPQKETNKLGRCIRALSVIYLRLVTYILVFY